MKGNAKIIGHLNKVLCNELTAINQYFLHYRMYKHWGYKELAGLPNLQKLGKLLVGEGPKEALGCDLKLESDAVPDLKAAIADCEELGDYVSRDLFSSILESEEEHIDWLETQLGLVDQLGVVPYLQTKVDS